MMKWMITADISKIQIALNAILLYKKYDKTIGLLLRVQSYCYMHAFANFRFTTMLVMYESHPKNLYLKIFLGVLHC